MSVVRIAAKARVYVKRASFIIIFLGLTLSTLESLSEDEEQHESEGAVTALYGKCSMMASRVGIGIPAIAEPVQPLQLSVCHQPRRPRVIDSPHHPKSNEVI